ncbi:NADPH--cytochrome P450 reductase [Tolypocladium paradoxum]|uniref:NADPH--cytochrome P450 reductase n=1 Tax=Tolypocladium paradoxum TaxID=94208 RepID=A0A2S4KZH5_9HYPO|nr:NADPH--cytochrome P450 reductase [Tolypocladium paradoxum]
MTSMQNDRFNDSAWVLAKLAPGTFIDTMAVLVMAAASVAYLLADYTWNRPDPYRHIWYEKPQDQDGATTSASRATRNIAQRLEELGKQVVVFWGSQSGTAESFAKRLARELSQRFQLPAMSADLSDFDPETIGLIPGSKFAVFVLATYGEGDPSDNANQFWEWAATAQPSALASLRYAAFGLGNKNYQHYNRVVDVVDAALQGSGAQRLVPVGRADDANGGTEEDFCRWKDAFFGFLVSGLDMNEYEPKYEPMLSAVFDTSLEPIDLHNGDPVQPPGKPSSESLVKPVAIKHARELFADTRRSCLHLAIDITEHPEMRYKTGDHLGIWPMNPDQEVHRLVRVLGLSGQEDVPLCINALDPAIKVQVPTPTTITALFRYYLEICGPVSRELACAAAEFAPSPEAKAWLLGLCSSRDSYSSFLERTHINLGRLLEVALQSEHGGVWSDLPLAFVLENLPRTRPRYYSISSSSVLSPRSVSITALVSNTVLSTEGQIVPGLATNYLLANANAYHGVAVPPAHSPDLSYDLCGPSQILKEGKVFAHLRRSTFKLPALASCPLIMLAAGTGIAPFRAFIDERVRLQSMGREVGEMMLFFGCRHPDEDYIYRPELEEMQAALGGKLRVVVAFSRLQAQKRVYIQDRMRECDDDIRRLVDDGAVVYACGRASMARDAGKTLGHIVGKHRGLEEEQVQEWVASMKRTKKWQEDVWG